MHVYPCAHVWRNVDVHSLSTWRRTAFLGRISNRFPQKKGPNELSPEMPQKTPHGAFKRARKRKTTGPFAPGPPLKKNTQRDMHKQTVLTKCSFSWGPEIFQWQPWGTKSSLPAPFQSVPPREMVRGFHGMHQQSSGQRALCTGGAPNLARSNVLQHPAESDRRWAPTCTVWCSASVCWK